MEKWENMSEEQKALVLRVEELVQLVKENQKTFSSFSVWLREYADDARKISLK